MVEWCNGSHLFGNHQPGWYEDGLFSHSRVSDNTILYKRVKADRIEHQHRIEALKAAVGDFIDSVATQKDSEGNTIDNRISLVTFASDAKTVKGLTKASTGSDKLKTAVSNLTADGATQANFGMEQAKLVLNGRTGEDKTRKSVVILFTDGTPTSGTEFESKVASGAIAAAKALKTGGTTVFTVGIFKGANPAADPGNDNTNKYMHAVSSNYPGATYKKSQGSYQWNFGERAEDSNYYLAASDANGLNAVFQAISNEVNTLAVKVDATSVLSDTLSGAFDFNAPENAEYSGITVAKYPVTGMENGVYAWGAAQELAIGEGEGKVQVEVAGKKLEVTGFDYGANAVTTKTEGDSTTYSGYKLVVTIPIKPDTEYHGWADGANYYDTNSTANGSKAGLEYGETGSRQKLELNDSPEAPVTGYTVSYAYKTGTKPDNADALLPSSSVHIEGQEYNLETTPSADGWTFTGWLDSSDKEVTGKQTMGTVPVTYYGKWEQKQPKVKVVKTATYTRDGKDMGSLPNNTNDLGKIGRVRVGDVINYTVTIENTGDITFGYNVSDYRAIDTFSNATGDLIQIDENGKEIGKVESGKVPPNISLGDMKPGDTKTLYYRYMVLLGDVGQQINNSATAEIKSGTGAGKITKSSNVRVLVEKPEPKTATLSFEFVNGTDNTTLPEDITKQCPAERLVEKNTSVTLETVFDAVEDNNSTWSFVGWYTDSDCTEGKKVTSPYQMPDTDTTLYGKWTYQAPQPETTTITVKKEWGTGVTDEQKLPVVVRLLDHGVAKWIEKDITLDGDNKWIGTFTVDYDAEAKYSVIEAKIGTEWFYNGTATIDDTTWEYAVEGDKDTGFTITNSIKKDEQPKPPTGTFKVDYVYKTLDGVTLPDDALAAIAKTEYKLPDEMTVDAGETVYAPTTPTEGDKVTVDDGEWEFVRWDTEYIENISEGATFTGYWKFTAKEPEPEDHEFTAHIVKRFENKSGKSPKATFTFVAALDDGTNVGRATISFSKGEVDAGDFERKDETMTVKLTDSQYEALEKDRIGRYLWIYEEDGEVDGVKYDTEPKKAYIYEKPVAWSLEFDEDGELVFSVPDENTLYCLVGDEMVEDFVFTNTYKKPGEKGETIKSGPQLNRDDHVAYIMGYPDGTVQPKGEITRAEACTIFFRLLTESSRDYYFSKTNDYTDVNAGDWFNNAISTLSNAGIVTGYNDGTFRPNQPITRGEMAKIIANFANLNKGTKSFTDLSGHWSKTYVELAAGNGWIAGYPDGSFRPDQKITRAETVTMINRVLERVPAKELRLLSRSIMLTFPDNNPGDWYYIAIQEASNSHEYQRSVYETTGDEMWTKLIDNVDWTKLEK